MFPAEFHGTRATAECLFALEMNITDVGVEVAPFPKGMAALFTLETIDCVAVSCFQMLVQIMPKRGSKITMFYT